MSYISPRLIAPRSFRNRLHLGRNHTAVEVAECMAEVIVDHPIGAFGVVPAVDEAPVVRVHHIGAVKA